MEIIRKNLAVPERYREFIDGSHRNAVALKTAMVGLGTYQPGWRWSLHAGAQTGKISENHIGYIVSGQMVIRDAEGTETTVSAGYAFEVMPGHDAWVVGNEACVALDFTGIE